MPKGAAEFNGWTWTLTEGIVQVMMAARKRMDVRKAREVANRAFAEADAGVARTSEAEKTFTSQARAFYLHARSHKPPSETSGAQVIHGATNTDLPSATHIILLPLVNGPTHADML